MTGKPLTIQGRLADRLDRSADRPAVGFANREGAISWLTTAGFHGAAAARASWLAGHGLGPGAVAVLVTGDPRLGATAIGGILRLGAVPLLVAPPAIQGVGANLEAVIRHVVGLTAARVVLLPPTMEAAAAEIDAALPEATVLLGAPPEPAVSEDRAEIVVPHPDAIAALQLTSGTTGFPRVCVWQHRQVLTAVDGMVAAMGLGERDLLANWTPLYHDMGLVNNLLLCLLNGIPLVLIDPLDFVRRPALWLRVIHASGATATWSPNFGYALATQRVSDAEIEGVRLDRVSGWWNAGEKVHLDTFERFFARFRERGVRWRSLKANFGCAENVGGATFTAPSGELVVERVVASALHEQRLAIPAGPDFDGPVEQLVSTGRGYPGLEVRILGRDGERLPDGEVGEVALASPSRLVEFMGQPAATAEVLRDDHVLTGDLGYLRDGELFWIGRARERINLAGVKHDPSDFEAVVNGVAGVRKGCFAAFGVEDPLVGTERLVLLCELVGGFAGDPAAVSDELRRAVATRLGVTVSEVGLVAKGQLVKTSSGKRRHLHFKERYLAGELEVIFSVGRA